MHVVQIIYTHTHVHTHTHTQTQDIKTAMEEATESVERKLALKAEIREQKVV